MSVRKASLVRNHQSPSDVSSSLFLMLQLMLINYKCTSDIDNIRNLFTKIITDRFQSQILRYTVVFHQTLPELLYLVVQLSSSE